MIVNIVLLSSMKPKQRRIAPLMKLAQVKTLKSRIQKEVFVIFLVVAAGFYSIGTFLQYFQGTNFSQISDKISRCPAQYLRRRQRQY